ncbi:MAG: MBL fold metallo-hydrolase [Sphingobacteriia bacterium]|nr:MBL fold metallo-hydrolase [Sphingobacteriia bacterium]
MEIIFLGTGTSTGVPEIGCQCAVCQSNDVRDKRLRCSVLVKMRGKNILLDCSPDFRQQMLLQPFEKLDGVLLTHEHYDHVGGLDDLRPYCRFCDVQVYAESNVCEAIRTRLPYCFRENRYSGTPNLELNPISLEPFIIEGVEILPIRLMHGHLPIVGFRIGNMAYLTDVLTIPETEYEKLHNLDILIIDALRDKPHLSHESTGEALLQIARIAPKKAYLIHMSHGFGLHAAMEHKLPENVHIAYDRLKITI